MAHEFEACLLMNASSPLCAGSLVCSGRNLCECPPGTARDMVLWPAPPNTCTLIVQGMEGVYITAIVLSVLIAVPNFREFIRLPSGPARTTFGLSWLWLLSFICMNAAHWAEGMRFGPATVVALTMFQNLSSAALCMELYHVIHPMMMLTRRVDATLRTRRFIYLFLGTWGILNMVSFIFMMYANYNLEPFRGPIVLGVYNYFLIQFVINCVISYASIKRLTREIVRVRDDLLVIRGEDDTGARMVLAFYEKLGNVVTIVLVHLSLVCVFLVVVNVCYAFLPQYSWPFYSFSCLTYPFIATVPAVFWYSGGKFADAFAQDFESTAATAPTIGRL